MTMIDDPGESENVYRRLEALLLPLGLMVRGGVAFDADAPILSDGRKVESLVLIGHAGSSFWPHFRHFLTTFDDPDPLDRWTRHVIEPVADACDGTALYPFDRPWWPFQRWISQAERLKPSPLGMLIHPEYGLWHGYRAALAFTQRIAIPRNDEPVHPCASCAERPCIAACPASAISDDAFDVVRCRTFLAGPAGAGCMTQGCGSRDACPVGREYRYGSDHRRFLMQSLDLSLGR